ncbi:cyclin-Q-like [Saccoglossus kowalevskii]|uniref:Cyclin-Q n=1 Tax=Saccoglossus kowalevskii TaxID=10224 RepID=A0ABM0GVG2_SACKO|nr:PREDICTED: cyclin-related protein FAM58A-like [Saccoglossus kowalevskii]
MAECRSMTVARSTSRETRTHFKVITYMLESGTKLQMDSVPMATACLIYHRFFKECLLENHDPYLIASSSIYLAAKVCEQQIRLRDILNVCYRTLHTDRPPLEINDEYWELRESLANCELLMLRVLKFQIAFELPHKYLLHYLVSLKDWLSPSVWADTPIAKTAWALLRDSYHSDLCLRVKPQHLAVTVLYFSLQCNGVGVPFNDDADKQWWQVFCEDIVESKIQSIIVELINMYAMEMNV